LDSKAGATINSINSASNAIFISFGMGFVYSLTLIYFLGAFAEVIAWVCVFLIQICLLGAAAGSFFESSHLKAEAASNKNNATMHKKLTEEA